MSKVSPSEHWDVRLYWWERGSYASFTIVCARSYEDAYQCMKDLTLPKKQRYYIKQQGSKKRFYKHEQWTAWVEQHGSPQPEIADSSELSEREEQLGLENAAVELGVLFLHRANEPVLQPATKPVIKSVPVKHLRATRGNTGTV